MFSIASQGNGMAHLGLEAIIDIRENNSLICP